MARITRRRLLKRSASGAVTAQNWRPRSRPSHRQSAGLRAGSTVHCLRWADVVPASGVLLKGQITQECRTATGITLKVESINANDLQRITSAIQSGTGPGIIMAIGNRPQLQGGQDWDARRYCRGYALSRGCIAQRELAVRCRARGVRPGNR